MTEILSEKLSEKILTEEEAEQVAGGRGVIYLDPNDPNNQGHTQSGNG